ncbi:MAG: hypothetical protein FWD91_03545 [Treponema sp.]|nr:hypothetical protein [Treponema sp.]
MSVTQTVDISDTRRITIDVPNEVPCGKVVLTFTPALLAAPPQTAAEALKLAIERSVDPNRQPISRHFGKHKGIFGGDGVTYQRAFRDEWD